MLLRSFVLFIILFLVLGCNSKSKEEQSNINVIASEQEIQANSDQVEYDDGETYIIKKTTDWEKLNLKGKINTIILEDSPINEVKTTTTFNQQGNIISITKIMKKYLEDEYTEILLEESRVYDDNQNLIMKTEITEKQCDLKEERYDSEGRLIERREESLNPENRDDRKVRFDNKYQYIQKGNRTEECYLNGKIHTTTTYDKYKNIISYIHHHSSLKPLLRYAYTYDKYGNMVVKVEYTPLHPPYSKEAFPIDYDETVYEYNENNQLVKWTKTHITEYIEDGEKRFLKSIKQSPPRAEYDQYGNLIQESYELTYDDHGNWIEDHYIPDDKRSSKRTIIYY